MWVATRGSWWSSTRWKMSWSVLLCLWAAGCAEAPPAVGLVSGKVTYNGAPVTEGQVALIDRETGVAGGATLGPDGAYKVDAPLTIGTYSVIVQPPPLPMPEQGKPPPQMKEYPNIPPKYREVDTSGLTTAVLEGENTFDIEMKP